MQAIRQSLDSLLASLPSSPRDKDAINSIVKETLSKAQSGANPESWKNQWEFALRKSIFDLAATEGKALKDPETTYYDQLSNILDITLAFTEHDACDQVFPFTILQDLLETQTISSCSHIFSWIEERAERLTEGMVPQKGKALVLLRTLNDLLRRLSNTGATTMFCGRILTFLSRVFPLGERSGVNLRGEYGPTWQGPGTKPEVGGEPEKDKDKMEVDETKEEQVASAAEKRRKEKEEFYETFWWMQLPFSRPAQFAEPSTFPAFKEAVNKVLPVIKEATAKDRALMGSKSNGIPTAPAGPLKRKRDAGAPEGPAKSEYYFAKYLTSPELLDLEIADTHFRRQFLFQLLILLNHLLNFTKAAKAAWATTRNRSLQMDFTLEPDDAQWVQETATRTTEELRQTAPNGRAFAETVQVILERERNWIRWKNELCTPFDREPWREEVEGEGEGGGESRRVGLEEATEGARKRMRADEAEWPHRFGSAPLTEIWEMGYRDLWDLQHPFHAGDVKDFVKKIKQEDARIEMRKKQLTKQAERIAAARARSQAAAAGLKDGAGTPAAAATPPISTSATTPALSTSTSQESQPPLPSKSSSLPALSGPTPLHPSLPAKPGTTPGPEVVPSPVRVATPNPPPAASSPTPAPAPAAALPAPTPVPVQQPTPAPAPAIELPPDEQIRKYEENKQRCAWLALRTARDQYLQHFGKIGTGDIILLQQEIENAKVEKEKAVVAETVSMVTATASPAPPPPPTEEGPSAKPAQKDAEGDVKMEER